MSELLTLLAFIAIVIAVVGIFGPWLLAACEVSAYWAGRWADKERK